MSTTIHFIACFHTQLNLEFSHCAFTQKCVRWSKMMHSVKDQEGINAYFIIEYANEGSMSEADEKVRLLTEKEFSAFYPKLSQDKFHGSHAIWGTPAWKVFQKRLIDQLKKRVKPKDIIAHPFGESHDELVALFPEAIHVETGIGYNDMGFGAWRIFESEAWRHYHWGKQDMITGDGKSSDRANSWVIPNYYDLDDWPIVYDTHPNFPYVLFMGRLDNAKGLGLYIDIGKIWDDMHPDSPLKFVIAGQGPWNDFKKDISDDLMARRFQYMGSVLGSQRASLIGNAVASLMPTQFMEPFGGSGVEGMLTGTPLIASDWGAFTETVVPGINGYRCKTLMDWINALEKAPFLDRFTIASIARDRYSLETCGQKYHQAFTQLLDLYNGKSVYKCKTKTEISE